MYQFRNDHFEEYEDAEAARRAYVCRYVGSPCVYVYCLDHGWSRALRGYCTECMFEVYTAYLERVYEDLMLDAKQEELQA